MKNPLELKALQTNRDVSTGKLWGWRVLTVVVIANVAASTSGGVELAGAIAGAGGVMLAILYALGEPAQENPAEQPAA